MYKEVNGVVDPEAGALTTIAGEDVDTKSFEHVCALIGPGASGSVLLTDDCKDAPVLETCEFKHGYVYEAVGGHKVANGEPKSYYCHFA